MADDTYEFRNLNEAQLNTARDRRLEELESSLFILMLEETELAAIWQSADRKADKDAAYQELLNMRSRVAYMKVRIDSLRVFTVPPSNMKESAEK